MLQCTIPALIPQKHIVAPTGTTSLRLQILACSNELGGADNTPTGSKAKTAILYTDKPQAALTINLPMAPRPDTLTVVCLTMEYIATDGEPVTLNKWKPAALIAVGKI